ncbi:MAG TPA: amidohydrolase family protein [Longimicrobiaceae bacterium]|nr:amidohydrolase family protein [Longimicrobiaceae bacterium]
MKNAIPLAAAALLAAAPLAAQGVVAIEGGTVHTMTGAPIEGGTVLIRDGRIAAVGRDVAVPAGARRVDARGKRVTPGLFESHTRTGLTEVGSIPGTNDYALSDQDQDRIMAAFNVADGLNPRSMVIPVTRIAGVTTAVSAPGGNGLVTGQGVVIDLAGDDGRDMLVKSPVAMYATLGEGVESASGGSRGGATLRLRELLEDARAYQQRRGDFERGATREFAASRLDLQAMQPVLQGRLPLVVEAHRASDIRTALRMADEYGLKLIVQGATEGWIVADELARARVPVIVKVLQNLPASFERLGARYDNAALLRRAGVQVAITTGDTHNARNVRQEAGNAVAYGLPYEEALRAVTLYPAQIWGVADTHGSLAPGKTANVVVWDGDPFEFLTEVEHVFIGGREVPLVSRQTELRDRYRRLDDANRVYGSGTQ